MSFTIVRLVVLGPVRCIKISVNNYIRETLRDIYTHRAKNTFHKMKSRNQDYLLFFMKKVIMEHKLSRPPMSVTDYLNDPNNLYERWIPKPVF